MRRVTSSLKGSPDCESSRIAPVSAMPAIGAASNGVSSSSSSAAAGSKPSAAHAHSHAGRSGDWLEVLQAWQLWQRASTTAALRDVSEQARLVAQLRSAAERPDTAQSMLHGPHFGEVLTMLAQVRWPHAHARACMVQGQGLLHIRLAT